MSPISTIALSGMKAAQSRLGASAVNIANLGTEGYRRREIISTTQAGGGVSVTVGMAPQPGPALVEDVVGQLVSKSQFLANLAVFRASVYRRGSLLDIAV